MDISLVILNQDSSGEVLECISSTYRMHHHPKEIIIVDNHSEPSPGLEIRNVYPDAKIIILPKKLPFVSAAKKAVEAATGDVIFFCMPVIFQTSLQQIIDALSREDVGVVAPKQLNPAKELLYTCRRFPTKAVLFFSTLPALVQKLNAKQLDAYDMKDYDHNGLLIVDWVEGNCMAVKKEIFQTLSFDEELPFLWDADFCRRVAESGKKVMYAGDTIVMNPLPKQESEFKERMRCANIYFGKMNTKDKKTLTETKEEQETIPEKGKTDAGGKGQENRIGDDKETSSGHHDYPLLVVEKKKDDTDIKNN